MSDRDIAVAVRNLSKSYIIARDVQGPTTAAEAIVGVFKRKHQPPVTETFWALQDINFDIQRGDVVGIIGRNGAGKSTLLKILSRIAEPTTGQIDLYGRVGSLLEVGTGFHPELTGRENVYLNGAMLGMTKREITRHFDEIVDFSEVGKFLDTPVKRYSSGMYVRLAFAVAAHLNPEILIVDEVLAVGDLQFQKKCLGKMQDVSQQEGRTIFFVSHQIAPIQKLCSRLMILAQGRLVYQGSVDEGITTYMEQDVPIGPLLHRNLGLRPSTDLIGDGSVRFTSLRVLHERPENRVEFRMGERIGLSLAMHCEKRTFDIRVSFAVADLFGGILFTSYHDDSLSCGDLPEGETVLEAWIDPNYLQPGRYAIQLGVAVNGVIQDYLSDATQIEIAGIFGAPDTKMDARPGIMRINFPWCLAEAVPGDADNPRESDTHRAKENNA